MDNSIEPLPTVVTHEQQLENLLSAPSNVVVNRFRQLAGDVLILGVAGKMGPSLAHMARRAMSDAGAKGRVIGAARFSQPALREQLEEWGIETIRCDLLDEKQLANLPRAANIIYMAGMKFGSTGNESLTWAMNAWLPGVVCQHFAGSRIVAFSTGNVYGLCPVDRGGCQETDPLCPVGEYAMSCLGRERIFEYFSRDQQTPVAIIRLNYACELRYGVLVDLARKVWQGETIDLSMGHFNVIWQADANAMALAALGYAAHPPFVVNVAGPETLSVRQVCESLGSRMRKPVHFTGVEGTDALLSNGQLGLRLFGPPRVEAQTLMGWISDWIGRGGATLNKPTHFESRDGSF